MVSLKRSIKKGLLLLILLTLILGPLVLLYYRTKDLVEYSNRPSRILTPHEAAGNNILITIRTTRTYHQSRLPVLFDTWLTTLTNTSNVFLVTDGEDEEYEEKCKELGIHYTSVPCGKTYGRWSLCCKSGEEMSLMHKEQNKHYDWYCHIDDDVYIIMKNLMYFLSKFDPKTEPVYLGRGWAKLISPKIPEEQTLIKGSGLRADFAEGAMYCLSRPMLNKVKPWLGNGQLMGETCNKLRLPEDWTVGAVVSLLVKEKLTSTRRFHHHGMKLSRNVNPHTLADQIGFAYGCGQLCRKKHLHNNAIFVPNALFTYEEDPSRFMSLHCHLYPWAKICKKKS